MPHLSPLTPPRPRRTAAVWLATGLGVGLVAPAPGTFGALEGLAIAWLLGQVPWPAAMGVASLVLVVVGVPLCAWAARDLGGDKDPGAVVWDELATVPLVFAVAPTTSPLWLAVGFGLHRVLDIAKPWPCRWLERLPGGWGIMADDVMAALYAAAALTGLRLATGG